MYGEFAETFREIHDGEFSQSSTIAGPSMACTLSSRPLAICTGRLYSAKAGFARLDPSCIPLTAGSKHATGENT